MLTPAPRHRLARLALGLLLAAGVACRDDSPTDPGDGTDPVRYNPDWTAASHGDDVAPNYAVVFPQASVNRIEIVMTAAQWAQVRTNMSSLWGFDFGGASTGGPGPGHFPGEEPDYVDVTFRFNGRTWKNVGFRLKGNSSLSAAWHQGNYKLPFRLQFDEFEDSIPAIADQRFYGFKELSLSSGWSDQSLIREKLTADVFRGAGVPAARTAFYRVYIDFGAGLEYCGVYTMVEVIDDTMVEDQFGDDAGNIYKPESHLATFVERQFEKKNNQLAADWSDVQAFVAALNSPLRTTNPAQWRAGLEATFDVDHFLKRLAVNNAIVNWDVYGALPHNYYLYNHPTRKLVWIPWDHNMSLTGNPGITSSFGGNQGVSLTMNEVSAQWPLLRYLADDPVYFQRYRSHMWTFNTSAFSLPAMDDMIDRYTAMIAPYAVGPEGELPKHTWLASPTAFTNASAILKQHVRNRKNLVSSWLP